MASEPKNVEESDESGKPPLVPTQPTDRAPWETALLLASVLAAGCAAACCFGSVAGWTSPTLGVVFFAGTIESLVAIGLGIKVLLLEDKRKALFVPGAALAAIATASLTGIFLLSGSI